MKPPNLVLKVGAACMHEFLGFCLSAGSMTNSIGARLHDAVAAVFFFSTIWPCSFHIFFLPGLTMVDATTYRFRRTVDVFFLFVCLILSIARCCY